MENENKQARVFVYRDVLGIQASLQSPGLLNNPAEKGQLGFLFDASEVLFSADAVAWLKRVKRGLDDLGEIEAYAMNSGGTVFGWLGGPLKACMTPDEVDASSDYDPGVLIASENVVTPEDFKRFVDKEKNGQQE